MANNRKVNILIGIAVTLAVIGIKFGTNSGTTPRYEWKQFLMEASPYGADRSLTPQEASRIFAQNCSSVSPVIYKQLQHYALDYTYQSEKGDTLWHLCQRSMVWEAVAKELKAQNVSMETVNKDGLTPWLSAAKADNVHAAQWLKDNGADTGALDKQGNPAWFLAGNLMHDALRSWGLEATEAKNRLGQTDFMHALSTGQQERAKKLFDMGANLASRDRSGRVALHYAAASGNAAMTRAIVQRNPEYIYTEDSRHDTPMDIAASPAREVLQEYANNDQ